LHENTKNGVQFSHQATYYFLRRDQTNMHPLKPIRFIPICWFNNQSTTGSIEKIIRLLQRE